VFILVTVRGEASFMDPGPETGVCGMGLTKLGKPGLDNLGLMTILCSQPPTLYIAATIYDGAYASLPWRIVG